VAQDVGGGCHAKDGWSSSQDRNGAHAEIWHHLWTTHVPHNITNRQYTAPEHLCRSVSGSRGNALPGSYQQDMIHLLLDC
jgi:hypothetical protein